MNLYISDLDGTLLNSKGELSQQTIKTINKMIAEGLDFTVATARGIDSVKEILAPLNLKYPVILNNGLFIYDLNEDCVIEEYSIDLKVVKDIIDDLSDYEIYPMISIKKEGEYKVYYSEIKNQGEKEFIDFHGQSASLEFVKVDDLMQLKNKKVLSLFSIGTKAALEEATDFLKEKYSLEIHLFYDIYSEYHWLEINPINASKGDGILYLKEKYGFNRLITFGDNLNDVSMFEVSDESYAMENANTVVKPRATQIIGTNDAHSVANYIKEKREQKYKHKEGIS